MSDETHEKPSLWSRNSKFSKTMAVVLTVAMTTAGTPMPALAEQAPTETTTPTNDDEANTASTASTKAASEDSSAKSSQETTKSSSANETASSSQKSEDASSKSTSTSGNSAASSPKSTTSSTAATQQTTTEDTMPATTLSATVDGATVKVSAPEGALPKGAQLVATSATSDVNSTYASLADANGNVVSGLSAVKLSFTANGQQVTPAKAVTVSFSAAGVTGDSVTLCQQMSATGTPTRLSAVSGGAATAQVKDFPSIYAIVGQTAKPAPAPAADDSSQSSDEQMTPTTDDSPADAASSDASSQDQSGDAQQPAASTDDSGSQDAASDQTDSQAQDQPSDQADDQTAEQTDDSTSTSSESQQGAAALLASINSLLSANTTAAATSATVTFVNDNDGTTTTGTLAAGNIAKNAAASDKIPAGYAFDHASIYNTDVVSFSIASDGTLLAVTRDGSIAQIAASKATDLQVHYRGSYAITYAYTIDGNEATAADAGSLVGPSGVTPNGTANITFTPSTGLSVDSVTASNGTIASSGNGYTLSGVNGATTVTVNLSSQHTLTFANSSNTYLTYGRTTLNSKNGGSLSYTTGSSVSFQLDRYDQWSDNAKVLNKLTITLASGEVMANIPPTNGTATTTLSDGTTITVTRSGSSSAPSYKVTITAASGKNVYGNISVSTNYKDQATSEVWVNQLVGVDYVTSDYGTANHVDGNKLYPGIFDFYVRNTRYSSTFTFTVNDGYTLSDSGVTITARDQNGNLLTDTSGHSWLTRNSNGSYTITIGADARGWQPKDIRISIVATPDATTTYTTSYDDAAASGSYNYNGSFTIPECTTTKQGQHFTGWVLEGDTSGKVYKPGDTFTIDSSNVAYATNGNFHFVSQWTQNGKANVTVNVELHNADGTTTQAGSATATVATGAAARIDQSQVEAIVAKAAGSDWASTYEPLNDDQFQVSSASDGQTITIVYCAKINLVNADSIDTTYDGQAHTLSASASVEGATIEYSTDGGATWSTTAPSRTDVGTTSNISVRASKAGYKTVQKDGLHISVAQKPVTVTANDATKTYGEKDPTFSATVSGTLNNDTVSYTLNRAEGETPGTYAITPSGETSQGNYSVTFAPGTLTITAADITDESRFEVSTPSDVTYNGQEQKQGVTVKDTKTGTTLTQGTDYDLSYSDDTTNVGTVTVTVTGKGNYSGKVERSYKINKATLTVTTPDASKAYDGTALTKSDGATYEGLQNGETVDFKVTGSQTEVGSSKNTYELNWTGSAKQSNYNVVDSLGTLEVTKNGAAVSLTAGSATKTYDGTALTSTDVTESGLPDGLTCQATTEGTITDAGTAANKVSTYKVLDASGNDVTANFTNIQTTDGTLTVSPRQVTLTSASDSKTYDGKPLTNHTVTPGGDGFVEGEGATYNVTGSITDAGSVDNTFTYTLNDNTKASNYNITTATGTLTVNQADEATVQVTGNSGSFTYDGTQKSVEGWTSDAASVDGSISVSLNDGQTAVAQGTNVGTYPMGLDASKFTATSPNYKKVNVEVTDGTLTITAATMPATVTGESQTITYDGQEHELTGYTTAGLLDGQTLSGLTYSAKGTNAGSYNGAFNGTAKVTDAAGADQTQNYVVNKVTGTLTVTAAEINPDTPDPNNPDQKRFTISQPADVIYNGKEQKQPVIVHDAATGKDLVEGTDYTLSYSDDTTNVGTVTVTIKGTGNYTGSVDTTYQIKQAQVVVKANDASKNYGEKDPSFSATVSGLVNDEPESKIAYDLTREQGENVGTYAITPSGEASQGNYSVTYQNGTLTINAAEINPDTPDPNDPTNPDAKRFTISKPADVVYNGLSQKDEVTVHDAATGKDLVPGTDYTLSYSDDTTNVGTVTVTVNGVGNYSGTVAQTYQITPATLTVTTPDASKAYDGTPLTAQGTVTGFVNGERAEFQTTGSQTEGGSSKNTYEIQWTGTAQQKNYTVDEHLGTLTVTAGNITDENAFTVSQPADVTYNGEPQQQPVTVNFKDGGAVSTDDYTVEYTPAVDAGTVTVTVTGQNNLSGQVTRTYQILPKGYTVTTDSASKTYDGTPLTAGGHVDGILPNETYTFVTTGSQTEAGKSTNSYTLTFGDGVSRVVTARALFAAATTPSKSTNYKLDQDNLGILEVKAANINPNDPDNPDAKRFTITAPEDVVYNGKEQKQPVTVHDSATGKDLVEGTDYELSYSEDTTNAGTVMVTIKGIGNYTGSVDTNYQIKQAPVTVTVNDATKTYGSADPAFTATVSGLVNGEPESKIAYDLTREKGEEAGKTYAITPSGAESQGNYSVTFAPGKLTIAAVNINPNDPDNPDAKRFTISQPEDVVYNGTEQKQPVTVHDSATNKDLVEGTDYELSYSGDTTNVTDAGVTVTVTGKGNYTGSVTKTYKITKRDATLTSASHTWSYNGQAHSDQTVTSDGFVEGEGATYTVTGTITNVGKADNDFTYALNDNTKATNYNITQVKGTLEVTAGDISDEDAFTVGKPEDTKYNGQEQKQPVTVTFAESGDAVDASNYDVSYTPAVDAGTVTVTVTGKGNLTGSVTRTYEIQRRDVTLTSASDSKTYDGTPLTNHDVTVTSDGFVEGEGATYDVTGSITDAGSAKNAFTYTLNDNTKASNYNITTAEGALTINPAPLDVYTPNATKEYDGTALTNSKDAHVDGLVNGEKVALKVTGSQTEVGSSQNTYELAWDDAATTAQKSNYTVVEHLGTLTVTEAKTEPTTPAAPVTPSKTTPTAPAAQVKEVQKQVAQAKQSLPKTGDASSATAGIAAVFGAIATALGIKRRRDENQE
ncbi:MAG: MBG domain-containing protein [Atopobiaceae bacterium]